MRDDGISVREIPLEIEVGKVYVTRGGWAAVVIWVMSNPKQSHPIAFYAVHKPGAPDEKCPIAHEANGKQRIILGVNEPPFYYGHPADIIGEKKSGF